MRTLRARLAALILGAMIGVVLVASVIAVSITRGPSPRRTIEATATQIHMIVDLVKAQPDSEHTVLPIQPNPPRGEPMPGLTRFLSIAIARTGPPLTFVAKRISPAAPPSVAVRVDDRGWIVIPIPDAPLLENIWPALAGWLALLMFGTGAIALFAAEKITRPISMLQEAVAAVQPDGLLPPLPVTGSSETKAVAQALNNLSARLKAALESRMRLIAAAGHDLRTPMTRMRLRAEFLDDKERGAWLRDLDELDRIADSAISLVREEVTPGIDTEPVRLDRLTREVVQEIDEIHGGTKLGECADLTVRVAPLALKRALRNLIANAATHGGGASVSVAREGDDAVVRIVDKGPGIPDELMTQVFEPFFRIDAGRQKTFAGAGLGLAIAQEIVSRSGGTLELINRKPQGLAQELRLPVLGAD